MKALLSLALLFPLLLSFGCKKRPQPVPQGPAKPDTVAEAWAVERDSSLVSMGFTQVAKGFFATADSGFVVVHTVTKRHEDKFLVYFDKPIGQRVGEVLFPEDKREGERWFDMYQRGEMSGMVFLASCADNYVMFRVVPPDHPHAYDLVMERVSKPIRGMHIK